MQRVHIPPGNALCRSCGAHVPMNQLSIHIAQQHPRPARRDMTPTLVRTRKAPKKPTRHGL